MTDPRSGWGCRKLLPELYREKGTVVGALVWWLIPITFTLLAIAWVTWVNRPRRPADPHETLAAHQRFTAALERSEAAGKPVSSKRPVVDPSPDDVPPARSA